MRSINVNEVFSISGGDNDGEEGEAEARANMDGTNIRQSILESFLEAACTQLGTVVTDLVSTINPVLGIVAGAGVTECCNRASLDACLGKPTPPTPPSPFGGGGASGGWDQ
jgi:hypothetical protein